MRDDDRSATEAFRAAETARIPRWYFPYGHLAGTVGIGLAALALALARVKDVRWPQALVIPAILVFSNLFEWWAHKNVLHRPRFPFRGLYEKHTPLHHRLYRREDMAMRSVRELKFVLMPASGVLGIVLAASPLALGLGLAFGPNVGWLALLTQALYIVSYELTHLCYHLPAGNPVRRIGLVRKLAEHHARHHDPGLMGRWNFNVTLPLADALFGTIVPKEILERRGDRRG